MSLQNGHGRNELGIVISFLLVFSPLYTEQLLYIYILYIYIYIYINNAKINEFEDKTPGITNLAINTTLNAKINDVKNEICSVKY